MKHFFLKYWAEGLLWAGVLAYLAISLTMRSCPSCLAPAVVFPPTNGSTMEDRTMPDWSIQTASGQTLTRSDYSGQVYILNFWATGCRPCLVELPELNAFHANQASNAVSILGVNMDEDTARLASFLRDNPIPFPVGRLSPQARPTYRPPYLPTTLVVDGEGRIIEEIVGTTTAAELTRIVKHQLNGI